MGRVNVRYIYHIEQRDAAKGLSFISIHSIVGIELLLLPLFKEDYFWGKSMFTAEHKTHRDNSSIQI